MALFLIIIQSLSPSSSGDDENMSKGSRNGDKEGLPDILGKTGVGEKE